MLHFWIRTVRVAPSMNLLVRVFIFYFVMFQTPSVTVHVEEGKVRKTIFFHLHWVMCSFYFPRGKHIYAIWWHGISTDRGIPLGTNCNSLIADLFFINMRGSSCLTFTNLNGMTSYTCLTIYTPWCIDNIFTIDKPDFGKHIPDIYPTELYLNKASASDKETSFLDFNIKVIGIDIHTSATANAITSLTLIVPY